MNTTQPVAGRNKDGFNTAQAAAYAGETYYGLPPIKRSIYRWMIAVGYFSIGLAGSSQMLSAVLDRSDVPDKDPMVRAGRYAALAGTLVTPVLYTAELGTPRKWYNMLRIYRTTSLMSMGGAWLLTGFGMSTGAVALGQLLLDSGYDKAGSAVTRSFSIPAGLAGGFMSMYMGTELEETSTPLWAEASPLLSSLFGAANASNALALFELAGDRAHAGDESMRPVTLLAMITEAASIYQLRQVERRWTSSAHATDHSRSRYALLYRTGLITVGKAIGLAARAARVFGGRQSRGLLSLASIATLATGFGLSAIMLFEGNRSADRAEDYFELTGPVRAQRSSVSGNGGQARAEKPTGLKVAKWLAIAGLAIGTIAIVMKPKKAY